MGAGRFGVEVVWAIEDCRHLSTRLELDLLTADEKVVRVPAKLMAQVRSSARNRGKSDPIDAMAVARALLREPDLPVAAHDEMSGELKLLVDSREDLVAGRTGMINRLRWRVYGLDPDARPADPHGGGGQGSSRTRRKRVRAPARTGRRDGPR